MAASPGGEAFGEGITWVQLARAASSGRALVSRHEADQVLPHTDAAAGIADALGVSAAGIADALGVSAGVAGSGCAEGGRGLAFA